MPNRHARRKTAVTAIGAYALHPKKHNLSFGRWAMPVMARKMQSEEASERKRAVQSLSDFVFDSRRVASKEFSGVVPILKSLCEDSESGIRQTVAECLVTVNVTAAGRRAFQEHNFYDETLKFLEDEDESVRKAANVVFQRHVISPTGAYGLVAAGAIPKLTERIPKEPDEILIILLHTLHSCCLIDGEQALSSNGLENVKPLLKNGSPRIREKAATVLKELTVEEPGRNKALQLSILPDLLNLCSDEDEFTQAKALSAVMMILNSTPGKFIALEEKAIERILPLTHSKNVEVRLNSIKVLTALSEAPEGRKILLSNDHVNGVLQKDRIQEIQLAAKILSSVIAFKP